VATVVARSQLPDLHIQRYAMITTPDRFEERIASVTESLGVSQRVADLLIQRIEQDTGVSVQSMNVSDLVPHISVEKGLILHDRADRVIDIAQARSVAASQPRFQLEEVNDTGHYRILRTDETLERMVSFLVG